MKITSSEEYGIRILIRIASANPVEGLSIPQLSEAEKLTEPHVAKICRTLRMEGFINSTPGYKGGYVLAKPAELIIINDVLKALGGTLFDQQFCEAHTGLGRLCTNSVDCSTRSLWKMIQYTLDNLLNKLTLKDLMVNEKEVELKLEAILQRNVEELMK
ncbi:RrF2 family transcriptional regulator [Lacibacter sediminis]|uniref:Rrf2 family transcriptional regulator n=1 Tax=Lacibacter sediminis TaxID=2760713 RepID=A0A7G5XJ65_9BACT|nr:Rrf2 family transcriptional regulator [Lacibacter sediminis]QNA45518.1 Rrf2 family transcriptional regulator [Lacibacter sediminis]